MYVCIYIYKRKERESNLYSIYMQDLRRNDFSFDEIDRYRYNNNFRNGLFGTDNNNNNMRSNNNNDNNNSGNNTSSLRNRRRNEHLDPKSESDSYSREREEEEEDQKSSSASSTVDSVVGRSIIKGNKGSDITTTNERVKNNTKEDGGKGEESFPHSYPRQHLETNRNTNIDTNTNTETQSSDAERQRDEYRNAENEEESNRDGVVGDDGSIDILRVVAQSISILMSIASLSVLMLLFVISKAILGMIVDFIGLLPAVVLLLSFIIVSAKYMDLPLAAFIRTLLL